MHIYSAPVIDWFSFPYIELKSKFVNWDVALHFPATLQSSRLKQIEAAVMTGKTPRNSAGRGRNGDLALLSAHLPAGWSALSVGSGDR